MGTILAADDLAPEMFVTIHSPRQLGTRVQRHGPNEFVIDDGGPVPAGVPLQVLGISLPFVVCSVLKPGGAYTGPVIVDLRTVLLSRVSPEFVAAVASFDSPEVVEAPDTKSDSDKLNEVPQRL